MKNNNNEKYTLKVAMSEHVPVKEERDLGQISI